MKKQILFIIGIILPLFVGASEVGRQVINLNDNWKFFCPDTSNIPKSINFDDSAWETINIPHTWNNKDAQDGGDNYLRSVGWYRKHLHWSDAYEGKRVYLECLGACLMAVCFVNEDTVGIHKGGYTAFRFDITSKLKKGDNLIAIKVDNRKNQDIIPLGGDFSVMGGIYRNISLVVADPVHIDLSDYASSGLYLTTRHVSERKADLEIRAKIVNDSFEPKTVSICGILKHPNSFQAIAEIPNPLFDPNTMYSTKHKLLKSVRKTVTIPANSSVEFKETITISNPHLWNGKADPYRYLVELIVSANGKIIDSISQHVGFRYYEVTKDGFFLNGKLYPLRGVNRHQDWYNMGYAITQNEHNIDFGIIYDVGANAIRFAHYPHDPYIYDLCDRYGLIAWAEIPVVGGLGTSAELKEGVKIQLRELIRQQYNRPSICFWSLQNEVREQETAQMKVLMKDLNNLAHIEDPTRLTVQASNHAVAREWASDVFAWNWYPGWYIEDPSFASKLDSFKDEERPTAMSEYGAGASIYHHEINPARPVTNRGKFHPEEYQNFVHEHALMDISTRDFVWGTFVWNMFDFASDGRKEGDQDGINDKELVTYDRKVKKDSYFIYKANWSHEPVLYITSRRYDERKEKVTPVVVYSNCDSVELFVNDISQGRKKYKDVQCGIYKWNDVELPAKVNKVKVVGLKNKQKYTDEVIWNIKIL